MVTGETDEHSSVGSTKNQVLSGAKIPLSLLFCGQDWRLFAGIRLGHTGELTSLPVWLLPSTNQILVEIISWNGRKGLPPQASWIPLLKLLWGLPSEKNTPRLIFPVAAFAQSFSTNADQLSQQALGLCYTSVLNACRRSNRNSDWWQLLKPRGAATEPESLKELLRMFTKKRLAGHSKRLTNVTGKKHLIPGALLSALILSNWTCFSPFKKRCLNLPELAVLCLDVSAKYSEVIDRVNHKLPDNAINQYLSECGFRFKTGRLSKAELIEYNRAASGTDGIE